MLLQQTLNFLNCIRLMTNTVSSAITPTRPAEPLYGERAPNNLCHQRRCPPSVNGYDRYGYGSVEFVTGEDEYINAAVASGYCSVTNSGTLSNGSTAKVACDYDVDYLLEQGYEITGLSQEIPVSGLLPVTYIDLFDGVSVEWVVDPEDNTTAIQVDSANPNLSDVKYIIKQSDDEGNVIVHASVDFSVLNHNGFEVSGNQFDKVYHIGRRPDISAENLIS